ncbi:hypothetical protein [Pseudovibrio sp. Ad5]|uniref:hypothetical protein n=1 Tax=Pseudovibrio sp. Ad5 TaxID=989436 RepID=UPI0012907AFA|nr:hypothetical protein [Pseudovibrio sp. Ad5]
MLQSASQKDAESLAGCANIAKLSAHTGNPRKGTASMDDDETMETPIAQQIIKLVEPFAKADEKAIQLMSKIFNLNEEIDAFNAVSEEECRTVLAFNQIVRLTKVETEYFGLSVSNRKNILSSPNKHKYTDKVKEFFDVKFIDHVELLELRANIGVSLLEYLKRVPQLDNWKCPEPEITITIKPHL